MVAILSMLILAVPPDAADLAVFKACNAMVRLFQSNAEKIWPGYDLSARPVMLYRPGKWALLLNGGDEAQEFAALPADWPVASKQLRFRVGPYQDLAGQLAFDQKIGGLRTVAIPVMEGGTATEVFAFAVHEAFHQYQSDEFHEADSAAEERYPIQDRDNAALAFLEMRILQRALEAPGTGILQEFVAVRDARWSRNAFVSSFERQLEIREGTAKYVEVQSLSLLAALDPEFREGAHPEYLSRDFAQRITDGAVSPGDMPRNRIYPVGAALGMILDRVNPQWKRDVTRDARETSLFDLLRRSTDVGAVSLEDVKKRYAYAEVWGAADRLIRLHERNFQNTLTGFESQPGRRVRIKLSTQGLGRSRSTSMPRWTVDDGRRSLCPNYKVYALRSPTIRLTIRDVGVLEEQDWEARMRTVTFFVPKLQSLLLNGTEPHAARARETQFERAELKGSGVDFQVSAPGFIRITSDSIEIDLTRQIGPSVRH